MDFFYFHDTALTRTYLLLSDLIVDDECALYPPSFPFVVVHSYPYPYPFETLFGLLTGWPSTMPHMLDFMPDETATKAKIW